MEATVTKKLFILTLLILASCGLFESETGVSDTHAFLSSSIGSFSTIPVYYPEDYSSNTPVIYLLNGLGADASAWGSGIDLAKEAFDRNIIFVSMTAGDNTYTNHYSDPNKQYEDYVLEVVEEIEVEYALEIDSTKRALCGISNGGGGAVYILSRHPDIFAACGSLSGTIYTGTTNYKGLNNKGLRFDVGTDDTSILSGLRWFHDRLDENDVDHEYYEHSGDHNWTFWKKYAPKQFSFLEAIISPD